MKRLLFSGREQLGSILFGQSTKSCQANQHHLIITSTTSSKSLSTQRIPNPLSPFLSQSRVSLANRSTNSRFASTYKAAQVTQFASPLIIQDVARKPLKPDEVRIGVYCCGINSTDLSNSYGEIEPKPTLPFVPGYEVCGEILEVGSGPDSSKIKIGQRVIGLHADHHGGFAEEMAISVKDVWEVDIAMDFGTGASLVNSYATALLALTRRAEVEEGATVLITGAAGRLGLAAVDLAANVYRCKVIAVCATEDKSSLVRERGAWATVTYGQQDLKAQVNKVTEGAGVSIIIDSVGGEVFSEVIKCVADEGKVIVAGFASKKIPQIKAEDLLENSFSVLGVNLEQYRKKKLDVYRAAVQDVIEMSEEKLIKPLQAIHYPLDKVNDALAVLRDRKSISKLVLDIK